MKILLFFPGLYSLNNIVAKGFKSVGAEVITINYEDFFPDLVNKSVIKLSGFPGKIRTIWESQYYKLINKKYLEVVKKHKPNLIFIYNDQFLYPDTLKEIKKLNTKIAYYLGDSPFFIQNRSFNILSSLELYRAMVKNRFIASFRYGINFSIFSITASSPLT